MEPVKLKNIIKNIKGLVVKGSKEIEITGLTDSSSSVAPGNLFIAKKGRAQDGTRFIPHAIQAGASCIVTDLFNPFLENVTQLIHPEVSLVETQLARAFYQEADLKLFLVGITGTNGKTTTSYLIRHLLEHTGIPSGLIGTIEWIVGDYVFPSTHTTPGVTTNYKLFYEMSHALKGCVMEVSSHALDQNRVQEIEFDVAVFTNLTQDHLDYHSSMEAYAEAKQLLFSSLLPPQKAQKKTPKAAVINADDPWSAFMVQKCQVPVITYGVDHPADLKAEEIELTSLGTHFKLLYQGKTYPVFSPLIGRFNVSNVLAALGALLAKGISLDVLIPLLKTFKNVSGRLEKIPSSQGLNIFVDYAHTEDALLNVLAVLREITAGKIITVFGCGGNRDISKRPKMGKVAEEYSDVVILTSDNPRGEDPLEIILQIQKGISHPEKVEVLLDRKEAIGQAIRIATPQDTVLIAGKGHETYQIFRHETLYFDDREQAELAAKRCDERSKSMEIL